MNASPQQPASENTAEPVAITGMAGRFPGADNLERFWHNLSEGTDCFTTRTDDALRAAGVPAHHLTDPHYVRRVPLLADADRFDAEFFGMTPREAALRDPQQRLFLELAHSALEDAGHDPFAVPGTVGVYAGAAANRYAEFNLRADKETAARAGALALDLHNNNDYVAATAAYRLGLTGPALSVATACSTSLVAVHLACQALRAGECETALAGGAEIELPYGHGYRWAPGSIYSRDGFCRPFDVRANGTVFGNGGGAVVLRLLSDALADGDPIRAVIRGSAVANDGADRVSFSAPGVDGQLRAVAEAMAVAGRAPGDIDYIEAHGTGTDIGDAIEIEALTAAYRFLTGPGADAPAGIALGSVKSAIGHLGPASGIAGLIKTVLCLEHGELVPTVHFTEPNPRLKLDTTPFRVVGRRDAWPAADHRPRTAAVSSFGVGGTNAHVVLEQAPPAPPGPATDGPELLVWSARTEAAEPEVRARLARHLTWRGADGFVDTAATLRHGRTVHRLRRAAVAKTARAAVDLLSAPEGRDVLRPTDGAAARPVALLFPGQGSQRPGMAAGLLGSDPVFTETMHRCLDTVGALGVDLEPAWRGPHAAELLNRTEYAQPLLASVGLSLAAMWRAWGIDPTALLGHSVGELTAALVAGVAEPEDGLRLVTARAQAMQAMPPGAMLAVALPEDEARALLGESLALAAVNGPRQSVLAGPAEAIEAAAAQVRAAGGRARRLTTSHAFHSPAMARAAEQFLAAFDGVSLAPPAVPVISAATGEPLTDAQATDPAFWAGQLAAPVRFGPALAHLLGARPLTTLEAGPGRALTTLVRGHGGGSLAVPGLGTDADDPSAALTAAGTLWTEGHDLRWEAVGPPRPLRRTALPAYPYQRTRHWISPPPSPEPAATGDGAPPPATERPAQPPLPEAGEHTAAGNGTRTTPGTPAAPTPPGPSPLSLVRWRELPATARPPRYRGSTALTLLPDDPAAARRVTALLGRAGHRVVPAHPGTVADVLPELLANGGEPALYVHARAAGNWPQATVRNVTDQLAAGVESAFELVRTVARGARRPPRFLLLTEQAVDVSGGEPLHPAKAALAGLARTVPLELPGAACLLLDIAPGTDDDLITHQLQEPAGPPVVALRGDRRWAPVEVPIPHRPATEPPIRPGGTYLITGGYGGLGLAAARGLAATGLAPTLVLTGRRGPTPATEPHLAELTRLGARVLTERTDITDEASLRDLADRVERTAGRIHGVLHTAGLPGGGLIAFRTVEQLRAVLRPKTLGTLALEQVFADRPPLDFLAHFSSRASLAGLVGSADYAAANAFLDAHATASRQRCVSVNWPSWAAVGMAARATVDPGSGAPLADWSATRRPPQPLVHEQELSEREWMLDEHRFDGRAVLPGTAHLDLVVRAARELLPEPPGAPVRLRDAVFHRPLFVDGTRRIRILLQPRDDHWEFTLTSGSTVHSTGRVERPGDAAPPRVDLAAVAARLTGPAEDDDPAGLAELGPHWHSVAEVRRSADEQLARLRLDPRFHAELGDHALHPALLDSATALTRRRTDGHHLPLLYEEITVYDDLPGAFAAHVRHRRGGSGVLVADLDLVHPDGAPAVTVRGFTMRAVADRPFASAATEAEADDGSVVEPDDGGTPAAGLPPSDGIPPAEGVALFFDILAARPGRQVAVRPYRDGIPVPPEPLPTAPPEPPPAPDPDPEPAAATHPVAAPPDPLPAPDRGDAPDHAAVLKEIWQTALGRTAIGPADDFFALGGDSLSAVGLIAEVRDRLGIEMGIGELFAFPTLEALAGELRRRAGEGR
ncbi:type I polyketide synthase [Streptomyces sp. WZ-12]|uniref:type I polyketide synthase n=1 Tax=Streptomyces sp. WZ-12 TaxID=3030210 RepID=UPI00238138C7|nr:type I polyketide synthase [Streptomyces sp. WZ-12]